MKLEHTLVLRETQPWRVPELEAGTLTPMDVMRANMEFFHYRAAEIMATILAMPMSEDATADQLAAFHDMAGLVKCRELSQQCARDLARYTHAPMAPKPASDAPRPGNTRELERIPTPKAVSDAFARIAAGLPPEPRKRL